MAGRRPKRCTKVAQRPRLRFKKKSKTSTRTRRRPGNKETETEEADMAKITEETITEATTTETKARVTEETEESLNIARRVEMEAVALTATVEERPETTKRAEMTERGAKEMMPKKLKSFLLMMKKWASSLKRTLNLMP